MSTSSSSNSTRSQPCKISGTPAPEPDGVPVPTQRTVLARGTDVPPIMLACSRGADVTSEDVNGPEQTPTHAFYGARVSELWYLPCCCRKFLAGETFILRDITDLDVRWS